MAERRMFAKAVVESGKFLRMPVTARLLYYDLGMEADDDGVVEAFRVMRTTGATEDDLKILHAKGFIRVLNDELVALICDWKVNNFIRTDRYRPSIHADLLKVDTNGIPSDTGMDTNGIPSDTGMDTEDRIGKESMGQVRSGEGRKSEVDEKPAKKEPAFIPPTVEEVEAYCREKHLTTIDAQYFVDYYTESKWKKANGDRVKNWRLTLRTWEQKNKERGITDKPKKPVTSFDTDEFFAAALERSYGEPVPIPKRGNG